MNENLPIPGLGLTEPEAEGRFAELQKKLVASWNSLHQTRQTGVVFHMMSALGQHGRRKFSILQTLPNEDAHPAR